MEQRADATRVDGVALPGFVDHHAHALRVASGGPPPWGDATGVRRYHEQCAARGATPVDDMEPVVGEDLAGRLERALVEAAALGICELWEAGLRDWACLDALLELRERGPLPLRVRLLVAAGLAEGGMRGRTGDAWCEVEGVKFYADGWLGPRTCAVSRAFRDEGANRGLAFESAISLARRAEPFAEAGWRIATHAIGDRAIEEVITAYRHVFGDDCAAAAPRIEHVQVLRQDLVEVMAECGIVACIQPGFGAQDHAEAGRALGDDWPLAYRWDALLGAGVRVVGGSDYPIDALSPLEGLRKLVQNPFGAMDVVEALGLMTDEASGTTLLEEDPRTLEPDRIAAIRVLGTVPAA